jgi:uroporphyrin-III C-methyltransferase
MDEAMPSNATGKVYLVGAGPGDPELLTVKAQNLLERADVVLHDDLVTPAILSLAGPQAKVVNVGKRCGAEGITQAQINARMIDSARRGLQVVRLKSGDPAIFGRLAEELDALEAVGVPFEVIPGITAGIAAAASLGASLTDRRKSSRVVIVTGHRAHANGVQKTLDWQALARADATFIIYMPGHDFGGLRSELLASGLPGEIPAAIVSRATTPDQRQQVTTLGELDKLPRMESPSILLIGWSLDRASQGSSAGDRSLTVDEVELLLSSI